MSNMIVEYIMTGNRVMELIAAINSEIQNGVSSRKIEFICTICIEYGKESNSKSDKVENNINT